VPATAGAVHLNTALSLTPVQTQAIHVHSAFVSSIFALMLLAWTVTLTLAVNVLLISAVGGVSGGFITPTGQLLSP
jgi:hypothetical protein